MISDLKDQRRQLRKAQETILDIEAQEIKRSAKGNVIKKIFTGKESDEIRIIALSIIRSGEFVVLFGTQIQDRVHLILACAESLDFDMRDLIPVVAPIIEGKGGGRPTLVEIAGRKTENLELALDKASEFLEK
jgi:alanyl-tRNA synthetase